MFRYSAIWINIVSFFLSIIIFILINFLFFVSPFFYSKASFKAGFQVENQVEIPEENTEEENINKEEKEQESMAWYLEIPVINLKAPIAEGTTKEVMDQFIGHFEETTKEEGNIGLAAHNRGYPKNYFENLKQLKEGDTIFYFYQGKQREYEVTKHVIIKETDWTYLEDTMTNQITLITCVENEPEYRRCIQGKEKKESEESRFE